MPNLAEICNQCKSDTEGSINKLRQENEQLMTENTELKNKRSENKSPTCPSELRKLLQTLKQDIDWARTEVNRPHLTELIGLYDSVCLIFKEE